MKRKKNNNLTQTPERRMHMRKRFARLSQFLNNQKDRNTAMAFFYTGLITLLIIPILYYLYTLLIGTSILKYLIYGIMVYLSVSTLGGFVIVTIDAFFND